MASGILLQSRLPLEATITFGELAHLSKPQLVGLISTSTDHLEQQIQQAKKQAKFWRHEGMME
jgi:hypothetical protein